MTKSISTQSYVHFRRLLINARKEAGLTQAELACKLDRPQSYISKYECGERRLDVIEFLEIVENLDIDAPGLIRTLQNYGDGRSEC